MALTSDAMWEDKEKRIKAKIDDMDEYLLKPLKQRQLIETITKCATLSSSGAKNG